MEEGIKRLIGYVYSSKLRVQVLKFLSKKNQARPMEIAEGINQYQSHVSNVLKEFEQKGLIECLTPGKGSWRVYSPTELGKSILERIK